MKKITKETFLIEILNHKKGREILEKYNFPCLHCDFAKIEMGQLKIGEICKIYRLNLNKILAELNNIKK